MNDTSIEPLSADIEALFVAERALPTVPRPLQARVLRRLEETLGLGGSGGGSGTKGGSGSSEGAGLTGGGLLKAGATSLALLGLGAGLLSVRGNTTKSDKGAPYDERSRPPFQTEVLARRAAFRVPTLRNTIPNQVAPPSPGWIGQRGLPARIVAGQVTDTDGIPVEGALVVLQTAGSQYLSGAGTQSRSAADGKFTFGPQPAWIYHVIASLPARGSYGQILDLRDTSLAEKGAHLQLALGPCPSILSGRIRDDVGNGIARARVLMVPKDASVATSVGEADVQGRFELCVPLGPLTVHATADGYGQRTIGVRAPVRNEENIELHPEGVVVGRVVSSADGAPVPHAQVNFHEDSDNGQNTFKAFAVTGDTGRFELRGLAAGRFRVANTWAADFITGPDDTPAPATDVTPGYVAEPITVRVSPSSTIVGTVSRGGMRVVGAKVRAALASCPERCESFAAVSQIDGKFTIHGVLRGNVIFKVAAENVIAPTLMTVSKSEHADVVIDIDVRRRPL